MRRKRLNLSLVEKTEAGQFPKGFKVRRIGIANSVSDLPPADIAKYFRDNPLTAERLLAESYDKRFTPSTFIETQGGGFKVGWYSAQRECVREYSNLADAATDYVLFSLGRASLETTGSSRSVLR